MNYMKTWMEYLVPIITNEALVQTGILVGWLVFVGLMLVILSNNYVSMLSAYFQQTTWKISTEVGRNVDLPKIRSTSWLCLRNSIDISLRSTPMWYHPYPCGCSIEFRIPYESPVPVTTIPSDGVLNQI